MKRLGHILGASASLIYASAALAQESPEPPAVTQATGLEDIVVTAQRRSERLQDVPVSITAFNSGEIARRQIVDVRALTQNAPSITFSSTPYGNNDLILSIRGVAPGGVLPNVDQAVGTYVDGLYYARPEGSNFALIDIASAEILRGPQGTLFGRNTIGGALNITTNKPNYDFGGSIKAAYGNYGAITGTGIINIPLIDQKLAARIVYSHVQHDGYGYNPTLKSDVADQNDNFVRASLRADLTDHFRVDISGDYYDGRNHQPDWVLKYYEPGVSPAVLAPYVAPEGSRVNQSGINPLNHSRVYDFNGTMTMDFGFATFKSITAYRRIDYEGAADLDGTPLPNSDVLAFDLDGHEFSQELQLSGKTDDNRLTWTTGAYYFQERVSNTSLVRVGSAIQANTLVPDNESMSAFAQVTYEVLPKLRLTGGIRYVIDHRRIVYHRPITPIDAAFSTDPNPPASAFGTPFCAYTAIGLNQDPEGCTFVPSGKLTFKTIPYTIGIDYKIDPDKLLYAKVARGYRAGGYQQPTGSTVAFFTPFGDESVMSYEAGAKLAFLHNHLRLSMAGYYSTYNNVQQNSILPGSDTVIIAIVNAGKEEIYGGEFEATALIRKLRLIGSLGLIHPKFVKGPYVGTPVPTVAKTSWSIAADYPIEFSGRGTLDLHAGYNYHSKVNFTNVGSVGAGGVLVPYTPFQAAAVTQKGYGLLDTQISFTLEHLPVTIAVYGRNLTNKYYAGRTGSFAGSKYNSIVLGDPRTYGVSVSYSF